MSPKLIVLDGLDGSGKQTQTKILIEKLRAEGRAVETLDFPQYDNNFFGGMIRQYLNGEFGEPTKINPYLASVLYAADRWESAEKIKQWLKEEKTVILDRYYTSNLIHQGAKMTEAELDQFIPWLEKIEFDIFQIPKPDLVIFLYVDAQTSYNLIAKRGQGRDGHDKDIDFIKKSEERALYLVKKLNWQTVECCQNGQLLTIEEINQKIWEVIKV